MVLVDLINHQTSQTGEHHESTNYTEGTLNKSHAQHA